MPSLPDAPSVTDPWSPFNDPFSPNRTLSLSASSSKTSIANTPSSGNSRSPSPAPSASSSISILAREVDIPSPPQPSVLHRSLWPFAALPFRSTWVRSPRTVTNVPPVVERVHDIEIGAIRNPRSDSGTGPDRVLNYGFWRTGLCHIEPRTGLEDMMGHAQRLPRTLRRKWLIGVVVLMCATAVTMIGLLIWWSGRESAKEGGQKEQTLT